MAIKVTKGAAPMYGRITMPQGTFLSSPSTAADGQLGSGSWGLPSEKGTMPRFGYGLQPQNAYAAAQAGYAPTLGAGANNSGIGDFSVYGSAPASYQTVNWGNVLNWLKGNLIAGTYSAPTVPLTNQIGAPKGPPSSYSSPFGQSATGVGQASGGLPAGAVPAAQANILGGSDGLTTEQVAQKMIAAGYMLTNRPGIGEVWVPSGQGAKTQMVGGAGERPEYVDGSSLAPGEDVVDAYGNRYVGGTPAPDGTPQYAVNYANPAAAKDTKGRYKWVSSVKKDNNGNWVRVNKQVLRKVYTRSHLKKAAVRQQEAAQNPSQGGPTNRGEYNQLVNFRANYG